MIWHILYGALVSGCVITAYFMGRAAEKNATLWRINRLKQSRDEALFSRDIAACLANERIKENAKLRQDLLSKWRAMRLPGLRN